jgi:hypothetical protein
LASYTLAFALQLRKKHGKTSVRVATPTTLTRPHEIIKIWLKSELPFRRYCGNSPAQGKPVNLKNKNVSKIICG